MTSSHMSTSRVKRLLCGWLTPTPSSIEAGRVKDRASKVVGGATVAGRR
jgi:hypothetical protein